MSSVRAFPQVTGWKSLDSDELTRACGFTMPASQQLAQVVVHLYKHGDLVGGERLRAMVYMDAAMTKLKATGDWFNLDEVSMGEHWFGRIGLRFSTKPWIDAGEPYFLGIEADYTRDGESRYLALRYDFPDSINNNTDAPRYALACEFYGYRKVRLK